jgi:hypothetical protein
LCTQGLAKLRGDKTIGVPAATVGSLREGAGGEVEASTNLKEYMEDMVLNGYTFVRTCYACPEQYDVYLGEEQVAYVRLRHGRLYACSPDVGGKTIYQAYPEGDGIFASEEECLFHLTQITKALAYEQKRLDMLIPYIK